MYTVAIHSMSIGMVPLDDNGRFNHKKPHAHQQYKAACNVAKLHSQKHRACYGVHSATGKLLKLFRPEQLATGADKGSD